MQTLNHTERGFIGEGNRSFQSKHVPVVWDAAWGLWGDGLWSPSLQFLLPQLKSQMLSVRPTHPAGPLNFRGLYLRLTSELKSGCGLTDPPGARKAASLWPPRKLQAVQVPLFYNTLAPCSLRPKFKGTLHQQAEALLSFLPSSCFCS